MESLKPVQVAKVSSSTDSWRSDLRYETAKIRSLYPRPHSDPLSLQDILDGNEVHENKENEGMKLREAITAGNDSTRKRITVEGDHQPNKARKTHEKDNESSTNETPIPARKLRSLNPKPYGDPLGLGEILGQKQWF